MTTHREQISRICDQIRQHITEPVPLRELARQAGMSPFYLQRVFKATLGVTPRQYAEACRMTALKRNLRRARDVTEAIYAAGFGSPSRVYERADTRLGMTPREYREGGETAISYVCATTELGVLMMGATDRGLCYVQLGESEAALRQELEREYPRASISPAKQPYHPDFASWSLALEEHLNGSRPALDLPLDIRATAFETKVWNFLRQIPYGETRSYSEVAAGIGHPAAARAVANACAANRVALLIPCHRVIRHNGDPGGYRCGTERKKMLLDREHGAKPQRGVEKMQRI